MADSITHAWHSLEVSARLDIAWLNSPTGHDAEIVTGVVLAVVIVITACVKFVRTLQRSAAQDATLSADRKWHQQVQRLQSELDGAHKRLGQPFVKLVEERQIALARMKGVWLNPTALERDCQELLFDNLWVLLPDYEHVRGKFYMELAISTLVRNLFPKATLTDDEARRIDATYTRERADLGGWVQAKGSLQPNFTCQDGNLLLLIELKRPSVTITKDAIRQAHDYAWDIVGRAEDHLWGQPVECLVIGGKVEDNLNDVNVRLGASPHGGIRITPLGYDRLIARAERIISKLSELPSLNADAALSSPTILQAAE